jgi:TPR repeat protein
LPAKSCLGYQYFTGECVTGGVNYYKANKWFEEAAADGDPYSQAVLGYCHYKGTDLCTTKNYEKAFHYLLGAARNDSFVYLDDDMKAYVYKYLSQSYRYGRGCEPDQGLAAYYGEKAAKFGDVDSKRAAELLRRD